MLEPPAPLEQLRDLELLLVAQHPIIYLETIEDDRARALLEHVADHLNLLYLTWTPDQGLSHPLLDAPLDGTADPAGCLEHIAASRNESLYHLCAFEPLLDDAGLRERFKRVHEALWRNRGAVILTGSGASELPEEVRRLATVVALRPPTDREYYEYLRDLLRDMRSRRTVRMELDSADVSRLIQQLRGLSFFEVKKVMTHAVAESWSLDKHAIARALEAKKEVLHRTGVLEYSPVESTLADIAGLAQLKSWLQSRKPVFDNPARAKEFGLSPPRGLLLLGVPGCGKSLSAKAVAAEFALPLIRLDPSRLYAKFIGETEENLRRAIQTAESMAPIVLWIDEIEKGLGHTASTSDAGLSFRVFGTFLAWMQDKADGVFVVATSNDISALPPELLRKGRFDEIFFVDLPSAEVRREILALHLRKRQRDPADYDLDALVALTDGYSGSEIEQAIVSALYAAYAESKHLETAHIAAAVTDTHPLSVTTAEKIAELRRWAVGRAVSAG